MYYVLEIFVVIIASLYAICLLALWLAWQRLEDDYEPHEGNNSVPLSIIVPFRNEAKHLPVLLTGLAQQKGVDQDVEIILVDDHSTDNTVQSIQSLYTAISFTIAENDREHHGKKAALQKGISMAKHRWIVTLDADVVLSSDWLETLRNFLSQTNSEMVIMPVQFQTGNFLQSLQALDGLSLTGVTASSCYLNMPLMCNGANLAFTKSAFEESLLTRSDLHTPSGDDVFLLHAIKKNKRITWLHDTGVIASTAAQKTLKDFYHQRVRWAGKAHHFKDLPSITFGALVVIVNLSLLLFGFLTLFNTHLLPILCFLFFTKSIVDFMLIHQVARWMDKRPLLWYFPVAAVCYPLYTLCVLLSGLFIKASWKGRLINTNNH